VFTTLLTLQRYLLPVYAASLLVPKQR